MPKNSKHSFSLASVFIHPDQTTAEQVARREAVLLVNKRIKEIPAKRHYILKGEVLTCYNLQRFASSVRVIGIFEFRIENFHLQSHVLYFSLLIIGIT